MSSKDDPDPSRRELVHDYLPPRAHPPCPAWTSSRASFMDSNGTVMDAAALGAEAAVFDYVLVGEGHTVACDHLVQASLLRALATAGKPPVVGLEMVSADRQGVLHGFNVGRYGPEALESGLDWEHTWGHPFSLYLPVFRGGLGTQAAPGGPERAPRGHQGSWRGEGFDPRADGQGAHGAHPGHARAAQLPGRGVPAPPDHARRERHRRGPRDPTPRATPPANGPRPWSASCSCRPPGIPRWPRRPSTPAAVTAGPVVVLAGAGHVEYGWGVGMRLGRLERGSPRAHGHALARRPRGPRPGQLLLLLPHDPRQPSGFTLQLNDQGALVTAVEPGSRTEGRRDGPGRRHRQGPGRPVTGMFDLHKAAIKAAKPTGTSCSRCAGAVPAATRRWTCPSRCPATRTGMPELPEVETIARGLAPRLLDRTVTPLCPSGRGPVADGPPGLGRTDLLRRVPGCGVTGVRRRAKLLLLDLLPPEASPLSGLLPCPGLPSQDDGGLGHDRRGAGPAQGSAPPRPHPVPPGRRLHPVFSRYAQVRLVPGLRARVRRGRGTPGPGRVALLGAAWPRAPGACRRGVRGPVQGTPGAGQGHAARPVRPSRASAISMRTRPCSGRAYALTPGPTGCPGRVWSAWPARSAPCLPRHRGQRQLHPRLPATPAATPGPSRTISGSTAGAARPAATGGRTLRVTRVAGRTSTYCPGCQR